MSRGQLIRWLRREGFTLLRDRSKHELWVRGECRITVPSGGGQVEGRLEKQIKVQVRKGKNQLYNQVQAT